MSRDMTKFARIVVAVVVSIALPTLICPSTKFSALAWSPQSSSMRSSRPRLGSGGCGRNEDGTRYPFPPSAAVVFVVGGGGPLLSSASSTTEDPTSITSTSSASPSPLGPPNQASARKVTLARWLSAKVQDYPELRDVESLQLSIQMACKTISNLITTATTDSTAGGGEVGAGGGGVDAADNSMRRLDRVSKNVLKNALQFTGRLKVVEAPPRDECDVEYDDDCPPPVGRSYSPGVVIAYPLDQYGGGGDSGGDNDVYGGIEGYVRRGGGGRDGGRRRLAACFDPLDGSGNADASICTGTVFGIFDADAAGLRYDNDNPKDESSYLLSRSVLQPGSDLLAAGYCLYSSTTMLVFTLGGGTHGFTLDTTTNEFVLTHPNMRIPNRGNIYSCNESYVDGWDIRFREYLSNIKNGRGETGRRYTQRYIGSMVGDVHRTLMYGGIFCCPADDNVHPDGNLQLVYKSAPMAYVLEHAGGKATDGKVDLLDVRPRDSVHVRSPCFMGSPDDMDELMTYLKRE